ncbi:hypothetical protein JCM19236_2174 [Vibrio sp. JCM 19236]|nr:hypothetical protein JCM19236_2174 [Vibrio sp. JCM 19236]
MAYTLDSKASRQRERLSSSKIGLLALPAWTGVQAAMDSCGNRNRH